MKFGPEHEIDQDMAFLRVWFSTLLRVCTCKAAHVTVVVYIDDIRWRGDLTPEKY